MKKWYEKSGAEGDAVISTRIRLARNLRTHPFPGKLNPAGRAAVEQMVKEAVLACVQTLPEQFHFVEMDQLSQTEAVSLVERHLVSPEFIADRRGRGLILTDDFSLVSPNYSSEIQDTVRDFYKLREELSDETTLLPREYEYEFLSSREKSQATMDLGDEYAKLILKDGDLEANWNAWVEEKMAVVQPVLDQLNNK